MEIGGSICTIKASTAPSFNISGTEVQVTHPTASTTLTRALSIPDLYARPITDATTPSITIDADWIGLSTEITGSGVTVTLDADLGINGDVIELFFSDAAGGTFASSTITVRFETTAIPQGKYIALRKISTNNYDMIGFS